MKTRIHELESIFFLNCSGFNSAVNLAARKIKEVEDERDKLIIQLLDDDDHEAFLRQADRMNGVPRINEWVEAGKPK